MIDLGVAGECQCFHGRMLGSVVNGIRPGAATKWATFPKKDLGDIRISAVWDRDRDDADDYARDFSVDRVAPSAEELARSVDGVLLLGGSRAEHGPGYYRTGFSESSKRGTIVHHRIAPVFLEAGVPLYVDKPIAPSYEEAVSLVSLAEQTGTPMMSSSVRRWDPAVNALKLQMRELGNVLGGIAYGPWLFGSMPFYGIHTLELVCSVMGPDVTAVQECGDRSRRALVLLFASGVPVLMTLVYRSSRDKLFDCGFTLFNEEKTIGTRVKGILGVGPLLTGFVEMIRTGIAPISSIETLKLIKILDAAEESLGSRRCVAV